MKENKPSSHYVVYLFTKRGQEIHGNITVDGNRNLTEKDMIDILDLLKKKHKVKDNIVILNTIKLANDPQSPEPEPLSPEAQS